VKWPYNIVNVAEIEYEPEQDAAIARVISYFAGITNYDEKNIKLITYISYEFLLLVNLSV
jgi:hypothetical protein